LASIDEFLEWIRCPVCGGSLARVDSSLLCEQGHTANIAKQGYVTLLGPRGGTHTADSREMLAARFRVLAAGLFEPISSALTETVSAAPLDAVAGPIIDLGTGTAHHLERTLEDLPDRLGLGLDNSKQAARTAARCHPRSAGAVVDIWEQLPLADGSVAVVTDVFAPRNGSEIARVLAPGGIAITVTPGPGHLGELIERFGMISVDPDKDERLGKQMEPVGPTSESRQVEWSMDLFPGEIADLVAMGPSAGRLEGEELQAMLEGLPEKTTVTGSVNLTVWIAEE
jgi:23S rRNA (guanine745-N1)-methyltransferase